MNHNEIIYLLRDVEASIIPAGDKVTLAKGVPAYITQSLGGSYTVVVNGNMFRIESEDADADRENADDESNESDGDEHDFEERLPLANPSTCALLYKRYIEAFRPADQELAEQTGYEIVYI